MLLGGQSERIHGKFFLKKIVVKKNKIYHLNGFLSVRLSKVYSHDGDTSSERSRPANPKP